MKATKMSFKDLDTLYQYNVVELVKTHRSYI